MRYFFIEQAQVAGQTPVVTGSDARHIKNVLRLKLGDKIGLFDGQGLEYEARILTISSGSVKVSIIRSFPSIAESPVQITIAQAFLQYRKMDGLVRQLTELGITKWIPFIAKRSVPRPNDRRLSARMKRWERIAREALKQCKRARIPEIGDTVSFDEMLNTGKGYDLKIAFWENESRPVGFELSTMPDGQFQKILIMLGPEGGFTSEEIECARACGFITAALGPRILRTETATIAACSLVQYLFGDMGKNFLTKM